MAQVALREFIPSQPNIDRTIARYVEASFERVRRALLETAATLVEPTASDPDLARARATVLVETLAGFAIGNVVGHAAATAKRVMASARDTIDQALATTSGARLAVPPAHAPNAATERPR